MRHIKPYQELFESQQGLIQEQKDWLYECTTGSWEINTQTGLVDVDGDFSCTGQGLTDFKGVRFGNIIGDFDCDNNLLTSLRGAPQVVGGSFYCADNQLTSLEGSPQRVDGDFLCHNNQLTSLEGAPQRVGGYLFCYGNPISETGITNVIRRMSDHNVSLEQAVSGRWKTGKWDEITEEDKPYLAKHNPDLTPEEKREYAALERLKTRII